jgi:hypothetical protein
VRFILDRTLRTDVYPVYTGYARQEQTRRLEEIQCYGNGSRAHRYLLDYDYSDYSGRLLLTGISEYGSSTSTVFPATTFNYEEGNTVRFNTQRSRSGIANTMGMTHFADINGDGFTDLIKFQAGTTRTDVYLGDDDGGFGSDTNSGKMEASNTAGNIHFGDIDGDGKADCVVANQGGSGYLTARTYLGDSGGDLNYEDLVDLNKNTSEGMTQLADVTGDGLADLIEFPFPRAVGASYAQVHVADGTGTFSSSTLDSQLCEANDPGRVFMADVNGDGLADIIQTDAQSHLVYVHLADGQGYFDTCSTPTNLGHATDPGTVLFGDINGDGLSDLILAPSLSDSVYTFFADGNGGFEFADQTDTN